MVDYRPMVDNIDPLAALHLSITPEMSVIHFKINVSTGEKNPFFQMPSLMIYHQFTCNSLVSGNTHKYWHFSWEATQPGCWAMITPAKSLFNSSSFLSVNGIKDNPLSNLLKSPDGELQMPRDDARLLVVPGSVTSQLQDLCSQILHDCCHVDWSTSSNSLRIVSLPTQDKNWSDHVQVEKRPEQSGSCPLGTEVLPYWSGTLPFPWPCRLFHVQTWLPEGV